jgi:hypothetical protein
VRCALLAVAFAHNHTAVSLLCCFSMLMTIERQDIFQQPNSEFFKTRILSTMMMTETCQQFVAAFRTFPLQLLSSVSQ